MKRAKRCGPYEPFVTSRRQRAVRQMMENSERLGLYAFERIFGPDGKRPGTADQERAWALVQLRKDRGRLPADLKSDRGEGNTRRATLAAALLAMPDVGVDADFARVNDPDSGDKL